MGERWRVGPAGSQTHLSNIFFKVLSAAEVGQGGYSVSSKP